MQILQPRGWPRPKGYSNGIAAEGRMVFVAGMIGWNERQELAARDFAGQFRQALENVCAVLAEGGARPEHVVRLTMYMIDKRQYLASLAEIGVAYREIMGRSFPAMSAIEVKGLIEDGALLEIEATAVIPPGE